MPESDILVAYIQLLLKWLRYDWNNRWIDIWICSKVSIWLIHLQSVWVPISIPLCFELGTLDIRAATVYPNKYAHGFCFAVLCCGYTLTDFPIFIRLTSLALWQSNDCPSASKATLRNMDKYFMWIHYERLHNINKAKHNKLVCIFLGIYCILHSAIVLYHHNQAAYQIIKSPSMPSMG